MEDSRDQIGSAVLCQRGIVTCMVNRSMSWSILCDFLVRSQICPLFGTWSFIRWAKPAKSDSAGSRRFVLILLVDWRRAELALDRGPLIRPPERKVVPGWSR